MHIYIYIHTRRHIPIYYIYRLVKNRADHLRITGFRRSLYARMYMYTYTDGVLLYIHLYEAKYGETVTDFREVKTGGKKPPKIYF